MKKHKSKIIIISLLVLSVIVFVQFPRSKAVSDSSFFVVNKDEVANGETIEMTLDITKINYDKFDFRLTSNLDTINIIVHEDVEVENYNNDVCISIDKSKVKLDKITFYYLVPENSQVGTSIELLAQILAEKEATDENLSVTNSEENQATEEESSSNVAFEVVDSKKVSVKIVEQKPQNNNNNNSSNNIPSDNKKTESLNEIQSNDKNSMVNNPTDSKNNSQFSMSGMSVGNTQAKTGSYSSNLMNFSTGSLSSVETEVETAVYNGSNNNYLSKLEIEGETLKNSFNKENSTYFVDTTGKTSLDINIELEDSTAKACITGNKDLKEGSNKILISVTAKNGDIRYYRIFVNNN